MPARTAGTPAAFPLRLPRLRFLPEHKVERITLPFRDINTRAGLQIIDALSGKLPVGRELTDRVIHVSVAADIGVALIDEFSDDAKHLRNEIRRVRLIGRGKAAERLHIFLHRLRIEIRQFFCRNAFLGRAADDLVIHIRDIPDKGDLVSPLHQPAADHVKRHKGAAVPDVAVVIDRHPADIHPHLSLFDGFEGFLFVAHCGVKRQRFRDSHMGSAPPGQNWLSDRKAADADRGTSLPAVPVLSLSSG